MQANAAKIEYLKTSSDVTIEQICYLYLDFNYVHFYSFTIDM